MPQISTPLADLSRDIAGAIDPELTARWAQGPKTDAHAAELLAPYARRGFVLASDTAGLSKMAKRYSLAQVLHAIDGPKRVIHGVGTALGGQAIGIWVADNTEMFFPDDTSPEQLIAATAQIHHHIRVPVGIALHKGTFYEIGGGLYGPDADRVELLAEEHTSGGDTLLTDAMAPFWHGASTPFDHPELGNNHAIEVGVGTKPDLGSTAYPLPYTQTMANLLDRVGGGDATAEAEIDALYRSERVVMLAERHQHRPVGSLRQTLEDLLGNAELQRICRPILEAHTEVFALGGPLVLASFADLDTALACADALREALRDEGVVVSTGIDAGPVYQFPMGGGQSEFAGDPVNCASKLAEDLATPGDLTITRRALGAHRLANGTDMEWTISGIQLSATRLPWNARP